MQLEFYLKEHMMLTCIYHPIDPFRVVEAEEADRLKETGVWFDCPSKAKQYRAKVEDEIKEESSVVQLKPGRQKKNKGELK
jgi:hypothetical protein